MQIDLRSFTERREDAGADLLFGAEVTQTAATGKFQEVRGFSHLMSATTLADTCSCSARNPILGESREEVFWSNPLPSNNACCPAQRGACCRRAICAQYAAICTLVTLSVISLLHGSSSSVRRGFDAPGHSQWENFSRRQAAGGWRREAEFSDQLVVHHVGLIER